MTMILEETIDALGREDALRVLEAVSGTLDALRHDAEEIGHTPEMDQMMSRIEAYLGHVDRQRQKLGFTPK